jgi:hypothetical protein
MASLFWVSNHNHVRIFRPPPWVWRNKTGRWRLKSAGPEHGGERKTRQLLDWLVVLLKKDPAARSCMDTVVWRRAKAGLARPRQTKREKASHVARINVYREKQRVTCWARIGRQQWKWQQLGARRLGVSSCSLLPAGPFLRRWQSLS